MLLVILLLNVELNQYIYVFKIYIVMLAEIMSSLWHLVKPSMCACKSGADGGRQGRAGQRGWISLGDALIFCRLAHTVLRGIFARASEFPQERLRHNLFSFHRSALHSLPFSVGSTYILNKLFRS